MGKTEFDFGAVPTLGLLERVRRVAERDRESLATTRMSRKRKARVEQVIDQTIKELEHRYQLCRIGAYPEEVFRNVLIEIIAPRFNSGYNAWRIRL
jgi:hypothetical protein